MLFAYRSDSATRFFNGLAEGDPVAWIILAVVIALTAFNVWRRHNTFSS